MSNKRLKLAGAVILTVALVIIGTLIYNSITNNRKALNESSFPKSLQRLPLAQVVSGPQAMGMISKLHGSDIVIKQGYIASYQGSQGQIMIWISESNTSSDANQLFQIMDQKISQSGTSTQSGQPPFTNRRELRINNVDVVSVQGMGMENYYYHSGTKVYWVAVAGVDPFKTLDGVMKTL